ncbi:hypothetical protein SPBR_03159 [Sporothrix brasiliensis 5110]|uniref:Uncharacterized protein n=1 Tax=Sporothrix brasiliensis 5110 TaxID=1398154 RepID=A0A0C2ISS9_9PEZI|nr:uncharacterized protein SPBR_03159 [Sporothrix brasiliensis 5110]KIH92101.1 hypothetical protein SPBR_03159 [Sporothrix brasiliensis 5110]
MPLTVPSKATLVALSLVPVVAPTVYLLLVQAITSYYVGASATQRRVLTAKDKDAAAAAAATAASGAATTFSDATTVADTVPPHSLPAEVYGEDAPYVVYCERVVSKPVPVQRLTTGRADGRLLTTYLRGTFGAFSWTPMGLVMHRIVQDPALRKTFGADHLEALAFQKDDVACGPHLVTYRSRDRAELMTQPLADKPDLVVHAVIVAAVETTASGDEVVFVNETWFWRHAKDEPPSLLESAAGRWVHNLVGSWMIFKGTTKVTAPVKAKKE